MNLVKTSYFPDLSALWKLVDYQNELRSLYRLDHDRDHLGLPLITEKIQNFHKRSSDIVIYNRIFYMCEAAGLHFANLFIGTF